jgi:hypothetical protein
MLTAAENKAASFGATDTAVYEAETLQPVSDLDVDGPGDAAALHTHRSGNVDQQPVSHRPRKR